MNHSTCYMAHIVWSILYWSWYRSFEILEKSSSNDSWMITSLSEDRPCISLIKAEHWVLAPTTWTRWTMIGADVEFSISCYNRNIKILLEFFCKLNSPSSETLFDWQPSFGLFHMFPSWQSAQRPRFVLNRWIFYVTNNIYHSIKWLTVKAGIRRNIILLLWLSQSQNFPVTNAQN